MSDTRKLNTFLVAALIALTADAEWIPTSFGDGADAEVRESSPTVNFGASTELASRVRNDFIAGDANDGNDRNSAIYTKFDLGRRDAPENIETAFRLTYRNNNLVGSRIQDTVTPNPNIRTGLAVYGLNPSAGGANWNESTIIYLNAPGITIDGDAGTKDFNSDLTFLGTVEFPQIGNQNHLPVGQEIVFRSALLDQFVFDAITNGVGSITLVTTVIHGGDAPFSNWRNFNYLFNPKEQITLNSDTAYDADVTDPDNPLGSPHSGADNSNGEYSPSLLIQSAAEPATITAISLEGSLVELTISNGTPRVISNTVERTHTLNLLDWTGAGAYLSSPGVTNWSEAVSSNWERVYYRIRSE